MSIAESLSAQPRRRPRRPLRRRRAGRREPWNAHLDLLLSHRSVRAYRPTPCRRPWKSGGSRAIGSDEFNLQVWSLVTVTDPAKKAALAEIAGGQKHIEQYPVFLLWVADLARSARIGAAADAEVAGTAYFETFLVAAIDAALAAQNATVAAESLGLSTVYIGAMRNDPARVAELIGLPAGAMVVFGLCVGYAAAGAEGEVKPRLPQEAVVFHETYGAADENRMLAAYDGEMAAFSARQGMADDTWTGRVLARLGSVAGMKGRERLKEIVQALGFPIR